MSAPALKTPLPSHRPMRMMDLMSGFWNAFWNALRRYWRTGAPRALTGLGLEGGAPSAMAMMAVSVGWIVMVVFD